MKGKRTMNTKLDVRRVWMQIEDHLAPFTRLTAHERGLYYHLLRHSRLVGHRRLRVSVYRLAEQIAFSRPSTRQSLRTLAQKGCLKIFERNHQGHLLEVRTPAEIPGCLRSAAPRRADLARLNCFRDSRFRGAIVRRERGRCFYCLRQIQPRLARLDHVVPQSRGGDDTYRNLVACCHSCNSAKAAHSAADFLRQIYRTNRLTYPELRERLATLKAVQQGARKPLLSWPLPAG